MKKFLIIVLIIIVATLGVLFYFSQTENNSTPFSLANILKDDEVVISQENLEKISKQLAIPGPIIYKVNSEPSDQLGDNRKNADGNIIVQSYIQNDQSGPVLYIFVDPKYASEKTEKEEIKRAKEKVINAMIVLSLLKASPQKNELLQIDSVTDDYLFKFVEKEPIATINKN